MNNLIHVLTLRQMLTVWSDGIEKEANKFADERRDLLPRRITNSQLYGLANIVRSAYRFNDIKNFILHQGEKAERSNRPDVQEYWLALGKKLSELHNEAQKLLQQAGPALDKKDKREALDKLHHQMVETFVQHLIAHSLYWSPVARDKSKS